MPTSDSGDIAFEFVVAFLIAWSVLALIVGALLYQLMKFLFRIGRAAAGVFGDTATAKVVSLGIACLFFPRALQAVFDVLFAFLTKLSLDLPATFYLPWQEAGNMDPQQPGRAAIRLATSLLNSWTKIIATALSTLRQLPVGQLVFIVALGALLGALFRGSAVAGKEEKEFALGRQLRSLSNVTRQNIIFFSILALAGYLSIAAIAAIPILREPGAPSGELSADKLKEYLEALKRGTDESFADRPQPADPFEALKKLAERPTVAPGNAPAPDTGSLSEEEKNSLKNFLQTAADGRDAIVRGHAKLVADLRKERDDTLETALTSYRLNSIERKGQREAARYFLEMSDWCRRKITRMQKQIAASFNDIQTLDNRSAHQANDIMERLKQSGGTSAERQGFIQDQLVNWISYGPISRINQLAPPPGEETLPDRPALGSNLGPFTLVASWLLRTESLPLALIVGMIGFGLLGSACSTFVREGARKTRYGETYQQKPLVTDLSGVIIRGLSAAVVVFLAAEGGLAIFGSGAAEPNPYVLLITCLVAAVFSNTVWNRAQRWLTKAK